MEDKKRQMVIANGSCQNVNKNNKIKVKF